ncbi:hypothetical protein MIDIC_250012 [Alphaproteobacteria bacterium]
MQGSRGTRHKVFRGIAAKSRTSTSWFYGLKLHTIFNDKSEFVSIRITLNDKSEFVSIRITPGNVDDRKPVLTMAKGLWGKLFGDKGYNLRRISNTAIESRFVAHYEA